MARVTDLERWLKTGSTDAASGAPVVTENPPATETTPPEEPPAQPLESHAQKPDQAPDVPPTGEEAGEKGEKPNRYFRELAKLRKEVRQLQNGRDATGAAPATAPAQPPGPPPTYEEDPAAAFESVVTRLSTLETLNRNLVAQNNALMQNQNTMAQEANYRAAHPNYDPALRFLQESEEKIWTKTGGLTALAADILDRNEEALERDAAVRGMPPEDLALEVARNQIVAGGRGQLIEIARRTGQSFPEVVINAAEARGWSPATKPAAAATAQTPQSAQARVAAAIDRNRGSSLSTLETGSGRTSAPVIQDKEAFDEFLQTADEKTRANYIHQRDQEDPGWFERMFAR